jgi:hypothetical protein
MQDRRDGEREDLLWHIDQAARGRGWANQTPEVAPVVDEDVEGAAKEPMETIHVYIVRESDLEHPPGDLVVESELAATVARSLPGEEGHLTPRLDSGLRTDSMHSEAHMRLMHAYGSAGFAIVLLVATLVFLLAVTWITPTPTITLIPLTRDLATTTTIVVIAGTPSGAGRIKGRVLASLTLTQSATMPATGTGHQDARDAVGTITFYNGLFVSQTVAAGTRLTGSGGVQIVTDQVTLVPPAKASTPPTYGQVTVPAHAIQTGPQGNIPVRDINQACCLPSVLAQNTVAFQGGQAERDYPVVAKADMDHAVTRLTTEIVWSEQAALAAQRAPGEALVPPTCSATVTANHRPGEEAVAVTVTVAERCTAAAYQRRDMQNEAVYLYTQEVTRQVGRTTNCLVHNRYRCYRPRSLPIRSRKSHRWLCVSRDPGPTSSLLTNSNGSSVWSRTRQNGRRSCRSCAYRE